AIGATGNTLRFILEDAGMTSNAAIFFGSLAVGLVGAIPARRFNLPLVLFAITGIICMIPSIAAYKVVVYFSRGEILGGMNSAIEAGFGVGAIAAGIGAARILTDREWGFEQD
ncbi:MAG TPA: threonine/serine exporter family protein, partial [Cyanophyceae cyanobacterium]